jgi:radical SAM-linked protein
MESPYAMRLRVTYTKTGGLRYTGHLDLYKAWERLARRAGLPLAYSQGFNPHPKMVLSPALPLGFASQCEMIDLWLEQPLPPEQLRRMLEPAAPPGVEIVDLVDVPLDQPSLQSQIQSAAYTVTLVEAADDLEQRLEALLAQLSLPRNRRGKTYDLRPLIEELRLLPTDEAGQLRLHMRLACREAATGRPEEVLDALGLPVESARITRTSFSD